MNRVEAPKKVNYSAWTIGLTHDTSTRKQQHKDDGKETKYWKQWTADSLSDAEAIEPSFKTLQERNTKLREIRQYLAELEIMVSHT